MDGAPLRRLLSFSFISSELLFIFGSPVHSYSLPPVLCPCCLSDHWGEIDCCVRLADRRVIQKLHINSKHKLKKHPHINLYFFGFLVDNILLTFSSNNCKIKQKMCVKKHYFAYISYTAYKTSLDINNGFFSIQFCCRQATRNKFRKYFSEGNCELCLSN